jgi:hypothetical protein
MPGDCVWMQNGLLSLTRSAQLDTERNCSDIASARVLLHTPETGPFAPYLHARCGHGLECVPHLLQRVSL